MMSTDNAICPTWYRYNNKMVKIGAFVSHPIQYQAPLFRYLDAQSEIQLKVYFGSRIGYDSYEDDQFGEEVSWDIPLTEGYEYEFLQNYSLPAESSWVRLNPSIRNKIQKDGIDVFWIHGMGSLANWYAVLMGMYTDIPILYRSETTPFRDPGIYRISRERLNTKVFKRIEGFCYIGSRNKSYYKKHKVEDERLFFAPYTVDNDFFQNHYEKLPEKQGIRQKENLSIDKPIVTFVGKLIEKKNPELLLRAFIDATEPGEALLQYVGDGALRGRLEKKAKKSGRFDDVDFTGFVNQTEIPKFYKLSDVLVLPSKKENWGLVVNEAMNFSLPIIASDAVGSTDDLVDEENGRVFPSGDKISLCTHLEEIISDNTLREKLGAKSRERIEEWGISETGAGIIRAAQYASE